MPVDSFYKFTSHLKTYTPVLITQFFRGCFRNIVSKIHDYRDLSQFHKLLQGYRYSLHSTGESFNRGRNLTFREYISARFIRNNALNLLILHGGHPTGKASCRMCYQDVFTYSFRQCIDRCHILPVVTQVWCHFTEEL